MKKIYTLFFNFLSIKTEKKYLKFISALVLIFFTILIPKHTFAVAITPIRTDVSGFGTWTDATITGTTYLQLLNAASSTISPAMNFDCYTTETLDFQARTFGGISGSSNVITVSISTDNGGSWTTLGTRTPTTSTLTAMTQFNISAYNGTQVKIRFQSLSATGLIGVGIDNININGNAAPAVVLANNGTQIVAANVAEGTNNHVLHKFQLGVTVANAVLTGMTCTTAGAYDAADITNLKVRYSADAALDVADATLSTLTSPGAAGAKTFPTFTSQTINTATTGYVFITADIAASSATGGNTINLNAIATTNLTFTAACKSGTSTAGGTQTIISAASISTSAISPTSYCAGDAISVPYTITGTFTGNTFTAQISTSSTFASGIINVGTLVSNIAGTVSGTIPTNTPTNGTYYVRVIGSSPAVNGANSSTTIAVSNSTTTVSPTTTQNISVSTNGNTLTVTEGSTPTSRKWRSSTTSGSGYADIAGQTGTTYIPNFASANTYYVVCETTYPSPCGVVTTISTEVQINVSANSITTGAISGSPFCSGATGINVPFTYAAPASFPSGGSCTFTAQLSDASGFFTTPTNLQSVVSNASGSQSISVTIPGATPTGIGYLIRVVSNSPAISGTDNGSNLSITTSVTPAVSIAITTGTNPTCAGTSITFTSTPTNGGGSPSYQWKLNGGNVGTNSTTYSNASLANSDMVSCVMTSNATCPSPVTATSNTITMTVNTVVTPAVSIAITTGTNPLCTGATTTFTATPTNGGGSPSYQWKLNGGNVGTNSTTYTNAALANGDVVRCDMTSNATCPSPATVSSSNITITNNTPAQPTFTTSSTTVAPGQSGVSYVVSNVAGVSYAWSYSGAGATITGAPTNSVTVDFSTSATSGNLTVTPSYLGCTGTSRVIAITVAPSALSNIIANASYSYNTNIDYTLYQTVAPLTNTAQCIDLFKFDIQDGGGATDADGLPTILNSITFNVTNTAMIRTAALFNGNALVSNTPTINTGAGTIAFSGLSGANVTAADGSTNNLTLRVTFLTTVTDNAQIQVTINNTNVTAAGSNTSSLFTTFTSVVSSTTGDRNRIEVTATKIAFNTQPTNTSINATMSPSPTVRALDANNNLDLDYTTNISITSTGTMTGDPISIAAVVGVATFSSVVHTVSGTGYVLTASSGGFSTVNSNPFDITNIVYVNGDYRTVGSGSWVSNNATPAIWERMVSGSWVANNSPTYATTNNVYIQNGHTINTGGSFGSSVNLKILQGGTFNCNHSSTTASTYIYDGGTLNVNASFTMASGGSFEVEDNGNVNINFAYGTPTSSIWQGVEDFHPNSNLTLTDWDGANDVLIPSNTAITTNTYNGYTAAFGNVISDFSSNLTSSDDMIFLESGTTINLAHGDLIFRTNDAANLADMRISTTGTVTSGIGGDFIVEDTYIGAVFINFKTSGTQTFTIKGDMILDAGTVRALPTSTSGSSSTINIDGNLTISGSAAFDYNSTSVGAGVVPIGIINLKGDLSVSSGGLLRNTNENRNGILNFIGIGDGLTAATTQTIDIASTSTNANNSISFFVKQGSYVKLINRDLQLGNRDTVFVQGTLGNEGTLDFGYNGTSGWLIKERTSAAPTGTTAFRLEQNGILKITHQNGIVTAPTADGNVQVDTRTFDLAATYHYIGKQNQFTGNALPSTSSAKVVKCEMETDAMTLTMSGNTAFSSTATVDATYGGHLYIKKGQFIETTSAYVTAGGGTLRMEPNTLYFIPKGNTNLATADADPIPRMSSAIHPQTQYYLNGGTIELAGSTAGNYFQSARGNNANPKIYKNLKFSGSNTYTYPIPTDYKNLTSAIQIDSSLIITGSAIVDCIGGGGTAQSFIGSGGLVMSGSSRLRIREVSTAQPELLGDNLPYSLTGGTVEFYNSGATQQQQLRGNYRTILSPVKINYYNIDVNAAAQNLQLFASTPNSTQLGGVGNVDVNSSFLLTGTLNVNSPAVLRMDQSDFIDNGTGTSQIININSGAGLIYANEYGIKTSGTAITDGNIRISGTRNFSSSANYGFCSSDDMVSGNGLPTTVAGLYVYKTFKANKVTLNNGGTLVNGILGLQKGTIVSSDAQKVTLAVVATSDIKSPANVGGVQDMGYDSSYVQGKMGHNSASTSEMIFSIGSATKYGPCAITPQNATSQTYNGDYTSTGYGNYTLDPANTPQLDHVSKVEFWNINSSITPSANDDARIKLFWRAHSVVGPSASEWSQLRVAHFDNTDWNTEGTAPTFQPAPSTAWGWVQSDNFAANFSPFTLATLTSLNPLPVELTSFTGTCLGDGISQLNWSTASELNSKYFILQRSSNGSSYSTIATINAAGNSNQALNYAFNDSTVTTNSNYYRLIEVDTDNKQTIYSFILVECKEVNGTNVFYNEPKVVVEVNSNTEKQVSFNVYEISGKLLHQENKQIVRGYNKFNLNIEKKLAKGIYIIQMTDGNKASSSKLWVH